MQRLPFATEEAFSRADLLLIEFDGLTQLRGRLERLRARRTGGAPAADFRAGFQHAVGQVDTGKPARHHASDGGAAIAGRGEPPGSRSIGVGRPDLGSRRFRAELIDPRTGPTGKLADTTTVKDVEDARTRVPVAPGEDDQKGIVRVDGKRSRR